MVNTIPYHSHDSASKVNAISNSGNTRGQDVRKKTPDRHEERQQRRRGLISQPFGLPGPVMIFPKQWVRRGIDRVVGKDGMAGSRIDSLGTSCSVAITPD